MKVMRIACAMSVLLISGAAYAADNGAKTDPSKVSPQSSHPGVQGDTGNKNGPAANTNTGAGSGQTNNATSGSNQGASSGASSGTSGTSSGTAPAGTNMPAASPGTDPTHDASGIQGAPGNKNGPAQKQPSGSSGSSSSGSGSSTSGSSSQ